MPYATATQLLQRFAAAEIAQRVDRVVPRLVTGQLLLDIANVADLSAYTPDEAAQGAIALNVVQQALNDAAGVIDGYLSGRYQLPLSPVPEVLERVACDLARYYLYEDQVTDVIQKRYDAAIKMLADVAKGNMSLGVDSTTGEPPAGSGGAELVTDGVVWGRQKSSGFL